MAADSPELAHLRWPTLLVAVLGLGCVQVVIVCTWQLLTLVEDDRIFSPASMGWVDAIVAAITTAELLLLGTLVWSLVSVCLPGDRKSTRLNSSHANISYAVFCLIKNNALTVPR